MNNIDLKNRTAIVTGAAQGFGLAISERFINSGAKVIMWDIDGETLKKSIKKINNPKLSFGSVLDVTKFDKVSKEIEKNIKEHKKIDIFINNAGISGPNTKVWNYPIDEWHKVIDLDLNAVFYCCKAVVPHMIKNNYGRIVNIGSASWMIGQGGMAAYTAAKSGVVGLTRSFARDLGEFNIRVNSVVPGWIMTERQIEKWLTPESEKELMKSQCLKRKLVPADVARAVLFFSSNESSACTNQSYIVDGGWI